MHHLPLVQLCRRVPPAALCTGHADWAPACASAAPSSARLRPRPLLNTCLQVQSSTQESSPQGLLSAIAAPERLPPYGPTELVPLRWVRGMRCMRSVRGVAVDGAGGGSSRYAAAATAGFAHTLYAYNGFIYGLAIEGSVIIRSPDGTTWTKLGPFAPLGILPAFGAIVT